MLKKILHSIPKSLHLAPWGAGWRNFVEGVLPFYYSADVSLVEPRRLERKETHMNDLDQNELRMRTMCTGLAIGMPIGLALSAIFLFVLESPGLIGVGAGIGVSIGVAIGEGLYQRNKGL